MKNKFIFNKTIWETKRKLKNFLIFLRETVLPIFLILSIISFFLSLICFAESNSTTKDNDPVPFCSWEAKTPITRTYKIIEFIPRHVVCYLFQSDEQKETAKKRKTEKSSLKENEEYSSQVYEKIIECKKLKEEYSLHWKYYGI